MHMLTIRDGPAFDAVAGNLGLATIRGGTRPIHRKAVYRSGKYEHGDKRKIAQIKGRSQRMLIRYCLLTT